MDQALTSFACGSLKAFFTILCPTPFRILGIGAYDLSVRHSITYIIICQVVYNQYDMHHIITFIQAINLSIAYHYIIFTIHHTI